MDQHYHRCPCPKKGALPQKIMASARNGETDGVISWLQNGGDIDAADMNDRTLLFTACSQGHVSLVRELLKCEGVHLNQLAFNRSTPLVEAAARGHVECVEAILSSMAECQVDYEFRNSGRSAVLAGAQRKDWRVVETFVKAQKILCPKDWEFIFFISVNENQWDIARDVASLFTSNMKTELCRAIFEIYEKDKWDYLAATEIFRLTDFRDVDDAKSILCRMLKGRDWKKLGDALRVLYEDVEVDISLAEAILEEKDEETQMLLAEKELDSAAKNGTLLVAAICGTSEAVATLLFDLDYGYPDIIMKNALIISCLSNTPALLQVLLERGKFTYKTLTRGHAVTKAKDCRLLMKRAVRREEENIIPLKEDSEDESTEDDDDDDSLADDDDNDWSHNNVNAVSPYAAGQNMDMELFEALLANMQQNQQFSGDYCDDDDYEDDDDSVDDDDDDDDYCYEQLFTQKRDVRMKVGFSGDKDSDSSDSDDSDY